jgi:hypothetical protein
VKFYINISPKKMSVEEHTSVLRKIILTCVSPDAVCANGSYNSKTIKTLKTLENLSYLDGNIRSAIELLDPKLSARENTFAVANLLIQVGGMLGRLASTHRGVALNLDKY